DLNLNRSKRVSVLPRFFIPKKSLVPDQQRNQAHHHQTAPRAGPDQPPTATYPATNKFHIEQVTETHGVDLPHHPQHF
ncbi:hypothetical protein Q6257_30985, partial [Klebsiella variicola]